MPKIDPAPVLHGSEVSLEGKRILDAPAKFTGAPNRKVGRAGWVVFLLAIAECLFPDFSLAAAACDPWVARLVSAQGSVEVRRAGQTQWEPARLNGTYCAGDRIQVGEKSRADVALANQPVLRLDQNSTITLGGIRQERTSIIELLSGALYFFSRLPRNLEIITAFVNAGVEGTEGLVRVEADRAFISIFEGKVLAQNSLASITIEGGQSAVAERGRAPELRVIARPRDAVQWALYYPPVIFFGPDAFPPGPGWRDMAQRSLEQYAKGDFQAAFESIKGIPDTLGEPRFFVYRAALLLAVGRVDEADKDLERALSLNPNQGDALALRSIIAVVQNDKEQALSLAQKALTAEPDSAAALVSLSYAQQAHFDLEGARDTLQKTVRQNPENALAWARLAELHLSLADLAAALEAAQKAVAIEPNLSRTQTVLGYAYLTRVDTTQAAAAFMKAIELDQADPLPRLGLGLAKIRDGALEDGRREIDIAVSLDPDNSLLRSYLGKAYFEEKRDYQAAAQYEMAKRFDPKDPTGYFYDAIRKQTTNRPVEALQDMEKAIELNDNRAVYRSRLELDSDLAARSASQARIYSDLGFQQLALVEGWKSVNTDPGNFSAHRFLADSYSILPRHEIARVSELLQSQLLQPLNMTPIQPHLAESNLFLISAGGPAALAFNEFNPLFNRNGINFQTTGLAGENGTYGGEGVLSGIYQKAAFSVGGFHFQTDGWRKNADQKDTIANAFLQFELSPQTSVQAEIRRRETQLGDLQQRFFPEDFLPGQTQRTDTYAIRLGGRHALSSDSILLGSFTFQNRSDVSEINPFSITLKTPQNGTGTELQHLLRSHYFNLTSGLGYFDVNGNLRLAVLPFPANSADISLHHFNAYTYANITPLNSITITLGGSFDYLDGKPARVPGEQLDQFNPKFGITWRPLSGTSIRAAAFRVLKRTLITDQTLEPTQVAGFNQFFDDADVTKAWRYGVALDQKVTKNLFGGIEFARRDLKIPVIDATASPPPVTRENAKEKLARLYLFWTPHPWWALRTEYEFERFENGLTLTQQAHVDTHHVPLGISFFHPGGLSANLTASYYHQSGKFQRLLSENFQSANSDFWTLDAALNYRLPKRFGFITVGATNLLNEKFKYFDTDVNNPRIQPTRMVYLKMTVPLP